MTEYDNLSDNELQHLAAEGNEAAEAALIDRYARLVRICARPYFLAGGDSEDLMQEGMLGLLSAIRRFGTEGGTAFRTYAEVCIRNRITEAVRSASRKKHGPLNDGVSLEYIILSEESTVGNASQPEAFRRVPEEQVLARESRSEIARRYSQCLSKLENQILSLYLDGWSYQEMASFTGKTVKSVDNAVQRIRRKLAHKPRPGDNS